MMFRTNVRIDRLISVLRDNGVVFKFMEHQSRGSIILIIRSEFRILKNKDKKVWNHVSTRLNKTSKIVAIRLNICK